MHLGSRGVHITYICTRAQIHGVGTGRRRELQGPGRRPDRQTRTDREKNVLAGDALGVVHRVALLALVLLLHADERLNVCCVLYIRGVILWHVWYI